MYWYLHIIIYMFSLSTHMVFELCVCCFPSPGEVSAGCPHEDINIWPQLPRPVTSLWNQYLMTDSLVWPVVCGTSGCRYLRLGHLLPGGRDCHQVSPCVLPQGAVSVGQLGTAGVYGDCPCLGVILWLHAGYIEPCLITSTGCFCFKTKF